MKIVLIGANGTVGTTILESFKGSDHEIIKVGKKSGDFQVDIASIDSIRTLFAKIGKVDAIVNASGDLAFAPLNALTHEQWSIGINSKFLGQVNLSLIGKDFLNDKGSITLISGILTDNYIFAGTSATALNQAIEGFAQSAALELERGIRINVVSPGMLKESEEKYGAFFPGHIPVAGTLVGQAFKRSVLGIETGRIYKVF